MKLSLDIFIFQLQKKAGKRYLNEAANFDKVTNALSLIHPNKSSMAAFMQELVKSFETSFLLNEENSKAICFQHAGTFSINDNKNTIAGRFLGGNTGQKYDVYDNTDATITTHTIQPTEVASLPFFFKIWFPKDFNTGVLIVQRYSTNTCLSLFKKRLYEFFQSLGFNFTASKIIPEAKKNEFLESCNIFKIGITWKRNIDSSLKPQLDLMHKSRVSSEIRNISLSAKRLISDIRYRRKVTSEVNELLPQYDPSLYDMKFYYINSKGQAAHSTLDNLECLLPSICLGDECMNTDGTPDWDMVERIADSYLNLIKDDLRYNIQQL